MERLENGEIDILMPITSTREWRRKFDFSRETVFNNWATMYRQAGSDIDSVIDLEGKRVAIVRGSDHSVSFIKLLKDFHLQSDIIEVDDYANVLRLVEEGTASAGVISRANAFALKESFDVEKTSIVFDPVKLIFATKKGRNIEFLYAIDRHMVEMKSEYGSVYHASLEHLLEHKGKQQIPLWTKLSALAALCIIAFLIFRNKFTL